MGRDDQIYDVFKIAKRMVKTYSDIIREQCSEIMMVDWQSAMKIRK